MKWILLGVLLGLLWVLCPALVIGLAANPPVIAFAVGFAARPAIARRVQRWAT
ncbi:hypothetical protein AB0L99_42660 [Streptomyces sp. NPDC051954]|uniref:hypothetical protein n=1 Tax=Streptomyces sp. NPDC051954 TaxID=3155524 RepID=UPI003414E65B